MHENNSFLSMEAVNDSRVSKLQVLPVEEDVMCYRIDASAVRCRIS